MSDWKDFKLGEVADIITGFPFSGSRYTNKGIRVLRGENVTIGDLRWDTIKCWDEEFDQFEKYSLREGDIVIGMDGSRVGKNRAQLRKTDLPLLLAQRVACVRARPGFAQDLIAYLILSPRFEQYVSLVQTGTSIPHISQKQISDYEIKLTDDLATQIAIAEILSSLDDKIELNSSINHELDSLASTLFKQWFIDFEFPNESGRPYKSSGGAMVDSELGSIPRGWIDGQVSDIVDFNPGEKLVSGKSAPYIDMASIPTKGSWPDGPIMRPFTSGMKFRNGDTLFARITPCLENGKTAFIQCLNDDEVAWGSTEFIVLRPKTPWPSEFGYLIARNNNFRSYAVQSMIGTSGRQRAQSSHLEKYQLAYPTDKKVIESFGEQLKSFFEQIKINCEESLELSNLRDALLPKLISGELEVAERLKKD